MSDEHVIRYRGQRLGPRASLPEVQVTSECECGVRVALTLYLDKVNHSPTGFEWGYEGSGPAQLAFAILYHYYCHEFKSELVKSLGVSRVRELYQSFKRDFVAKWGDTWEITSTELGAWIDHQYEERDKRCQSTGKEFSSK